MYEVLIQSSARRINRAAGEYLAQQSARRRFDSKASAREWAGEISVDDGPVRIQDVAPNDPRNIDGYLVADPVHSRQSHHQTTGDTVSLECFDPQADGSSAEEPRS